MAGPQPSYFAVLGTFARNGLVRDMTFRTNFFIELFTVVFWAGMNLCFYFLLYQFADEMGRGSGWSKWPFFIFLATGMFINSLMQAFLVPNAVEFSELIRKGNLDFVLLKPIDTQFVVSFQRVKWSALSTFLVGVGLLGYSLHRLDYAPGFSVVLLYPIYIICGVAIMYSVMMCLASMTVWMGRNQNLTDFWFYLTIFSRYPLEIYTGRMGRPIQIGFTFIVPILLAVNIPARFMAKPLDEGQGWLALYALAAAAVSLLVSRRFFNLALSGYRSASS